MIVAIHNKNGKGLLLAAGKSPKVNTVVSQSTIKMEKGYYIDSTVPKAIVQVLSQSTIKMEKGYYKKLILT